MKKSAICLFLLVVATTVFGQQIRIRGSVDFSFNLANIQPGEDYSLATESKQDGVRLDIKNLRRQANWRVTVSKSDINWDNNVKVYVRRTSSGNGNGSLWGCSNYTQIRNMPQTVLQGRGALNNIYLQYKLDGISLSLPANTYNTDIIYTLYEQ